MNCNICNNEFNYIEGLKFCPYCGSKLNVQFIPSEEEPKDSVVDDEIVTEVITQEFVEAEEIENIGSEASESEVNVHDTLEMPIITDDMIKEDKKLKGALRRAQVAAKIKNTIKSKAFIIPFFALVVLGLSGFLAYSFLLNKNVEVGQIKGDLTGKIVVLPKGTNFEIKKEYLKELTITNRNFNKEEATEYIDLNTTLNNGSIEVNGVLQIAYKKEARNQWKLLEAVQISKDAAVKAVAGMEETRLLEELKKQKVTVAGEEVLLADEIIKGLKILQRTPNFQEGKEEVLAEVFIDGGVLSAKGNIITMLSFSDENWIVESMKNANEQNFEISLSDSITEEVLLTQIKNKALEENVNHAGVFGGKSFLVSDKFTKSMKVEGKSLDDSKKKLSVSLKRDNTSGVLNTTLSADYVFNVSLKNITFNSNTKSNVAATSITNITKEQIVSSLSGAKLEGRNDFFWWSENHEITGEEAKSFKLDEMLSKKGYQNISYVYGDVTYKEGKKDKAVSIVAIYYLVYDSSKGYVWKLDSVIGSESSKYSYYSKDAIKGQ